MVIKINGKELSRDELHLERIKCIKYALICNLAPIPFLIATEMTSHYLQLFFLSVSGAFAILDFYVIGRLLYLMVGTYKD